MGPQLFCPKISEWKKKVILCHGNFDVVHPGHVRHLAYAKSKAKILIVSITADIHIKKAKYRPHVPENIRLLNLAAFEMVDYVIIDRNETPIFNLKKIKPDFFDNKQKYCVLSSVNFFDNNTLKCILDAYE